MKRTLICPILIGLLFSGPASLLAYEIQTHADMSREAAKASVLRDNSPNGVLRVLGLRFPIEENIKQVFPNSKNDKKSVLELFRDGARFEDSLLFIRPIHHFYDPISGDALLSLLAKPSPTWALEDKGQINFPLFQRYSFTDSRDYFYRALTATTPDDHDLYFGKTFETLGHVIHHIQDMAQPQHVRLDPHLKLSDADKPDWVFEKGSRYETYTKGLGDNLPFNTYAPVNNKDDVNYLTTARSFWHTAQGGGKGLAEFTNSNFVSAGTNFDTDRYPSPNRVQATAHDESVNSLFQKEGLTLPPECQDSNPPCVMTFYRSRVQDNYRSAESKDNDYTSTESIFDQDLQVQNKRAFSLNRFNFIAAHEFLIPRAVAYSAGMIDYFFRGQLSAEDVVFTDTGINLRVKNAIDPAKTPAWANEILYATGGQQQPSALTIVYEYKDAAGETQYGVSNTMPMTAEPNGATGIAPGQTSQNVYAFTLSVPAEAAEVKYRLVFRGRLGQEDNAVAVGPADPISGFVFNPSYVPADGITGSRVIYKQGGQWRLTDQQNKVAGNIDWKGWYRNGRPTKVLSWVGPNSRYFPASYLPSSSNYFGPVNNKIFQDGEIFATAPRAVLGAALTRDSAGREWLLAICRDGMADVVYRRPNVKSNSQTGWDEIERFAHDPKLLNAANTPWFFNGNGTEAQTIRSGYKAGDPKLRLFRLRISIAENSAAFSNEGNLDNDANVGAFTGTKTCNENQSAPGFCASNCSGAYAENLSSDTKVTVQTGWSGSSVIAVDYIQDTPVFATYSTATDTTYALNTSWKRSFNTTCNGSFLGGACRTDSSWEIKDTRNVEKRYNTVEKIGMSGFGDIIMGSVSGTLQVDATKTDAGINNNTLSTTIDKSGGGDFKYTTSRLRYLDLRYGLYSLRSETKASSGQTTDVQVFGTGPFHGADYLVFLPRKTTIKQVTGYSGELPFPQIDLPEDIVPYDLDDHKLVPECNSTVTNPGGVPQPIFMDPSGIFSGGSWAVDSNKNLFLSESKLDKDMRGVGAFNYLTGATGGYPGSVIPTAPQGAYYDGIGVIK